MKNFSFILNSRGRPKMLKNLIESITNTTSDLSKINMYCALDDDDFDSIEFSKEKQLFEVNFVIGPRPESLNQSLTNLGLMADGRFQQNTNDDVHYDETCKNWDTRILERVEDFKKQNKILDDIIYVACKDSSIDKPLGAKYASFPTISSKAVKVLGYHMDPLFLGLEADNALYRVYSGVNRVIHIEDIVFRHYLHEDIFKIMSCDQTAAEMRAKSRKITLTADNYDPNPSIEKLKEFIKNYK